MSRFISSYDFSDVAARLCWPIQFYYHLLQAMSQYSIASLLSSSLSHQKSDQILVPSSQSPTIPSQHSHSIFCDKNTEQSSWMESSADRSTMSSLSSSETNYGGSSTQAVFDRFIPQRSASQCEPMFLRKSEKKSLEEESSTLEQLYSHVLLNNRGQENRQGIEVYTNRNRFRFGPSAPYTNNSKPWQCELSTRSTPWGKQRKINKMPIKVLDAPALQDDFYLNLLDWSPYDYLTVGLATSVYLWKSSNCQVTKLCDLGVRNFVTSVSCCSKQPVVALGTQSGVVQVWDVVKMERIRSFGGHSQRVGSLAWGNSLLTTGSRDNLILNRDLRCSIPYTSRLSYHKQEVCGLKWSFDDQQLCSGGNDNTLLIWIKHSHSPLHKFHDHKAAVKAVAWSPHQHGLLASGGGTADRTIKFRNTLTGQTIGSWQTDSQVCNLIFSRSEKELVSTHGYSKNEVAVWDCGSMRRVVSLKGHTYRVLYLAMSPDGSTVVTGAGDETLRFWHLFSSTSSCSFSGYELDECSVVIR